MWGTYFVILLSNTQGASATETYVPFLVTPTKVLSTVVSSKATAKIVTEQELWNSVGNSVVQHSIEFDNIEAHSCYRNVHGFL